MNHFDLPARWRKWRAVRRQKLIDLGMDPFDAGRFATDEAHGRNRLEASVGFENARSAELLRLETPAGSRFFAVGKDIEKLPPEYRAEASRLTAEAMQTICAATAA